VFSYGTLICCAGRIEIGDDVQIGEYCSIRDSTHSYEISGKPMKYNPDIILSVTIGNDVWIGRGCMIMPGSVIEDGVVVGANSVVRGVLKRDSIYAGSPARFIKSRR
jgi:acetyltransferase-like isoleucine patch superfamily enzyme